LEKSGDSEGENQETRKIRLEDLGLGLGGFGPPVAGEVCYDG
jgi:hypothetical protein